MPTYEQVARFMAEYARLTSEQRWAFRRAVALFREGLETGQFHPSLGVKGFRSESGVFELRWAKDGRALWEYGDPVPGRDGPHVRWLRIGTHDIYKSR
ncbi:hypothetical protein MXD61_00255 [Frankia sp. AgPm24]|uniref:hypothetical protein n=1 Tax=Frankia sp. AgPm24 TaxID=631128 RepID=UPI00200F7810|nr:hypothetical protein [Frankia sp. AgPm24]MCK9920359.1 hypothetical protein [Frankia sp. AgPm24]